VTPLDDSRELYNTQKGLTLLIMKSRSFR
jgi:hypothetical protein